MTEKNHELIQVVTTCGSREEADRIAAALVDSRLAACVHVHAPITSIYRWQGAVERSEEWLLTAKTTRPLFAAISATIRQEHSYEVPQIIALSIAAASVDYAAWLREQVERPRKGDG